MKKLMIALVAIATALVGSAATVNWSVAKGYVYDGATTPAKVDGTAYLMYVTATFGQSELVSAFAAANGDTTATVKAMTDSGNLATGTIAIESGRGTGASTSTLAGADGTAYFVVFNDNKMYVSITGESLYDSVSGESTLDFTSVSASSKLNYQAADGYSAAGWYAVPEPTSGLLLLLGMAGLALKRKIA